MVHISKYSRSSILRNIAKFREKAAQELYNKSYEQLDSHRQNIAMRWSHMNQHSGTYK